ncbi:MAG: M20/M25/M40 family metallo-hydrolase [Wolinella sp.]
MFSSPLNLFKALTKIPHGSGDTALMREFLAKTARGFGADVIEDSGGNLLCIKGGDARICLQAHYDMVCVGRASDGGEIECIERDGYISARDSSLGADNGAALACALLTLKQETNIEVLFTNDEEIGMLGAKALTLMPSAPLILNLDSERLDEIIVSCAGGYDMSIKVPLMAKKPDFSKYGYSLRTRGFLGGHSGVDIIENRKNAIVELAHLLDELDVELVSFEGGEKSNSIPVGASAIVVSDTPLAHLPDWVECERIEAGNKRVDKSAILSLLKSLHSGVYVYDKESESVLCSLNISLLKMDSDFFVLTVMGRANELILLERNLDQVELIARSFGAIECDVCDFYPPWERVKESKYLPKIAEIYARELGDYRIKSIHAGLECAVLCEKIPRSEFISIGPTIKNPHSLKEAMDLRSFEKFWEILQVIVKIV